MIEPLLLLLRRHSGRLRCSVRMNWYSLVRSALWLLLRLVEARLLVLLLLLLSILLLFVAKLLPLLSDKAVALLLIWCRLTSVLHFVESHVAADQVEALNDEQ